MYSQRTCQACFLDKGGLGFLSHSPTPFICFSSWSSLTLQTLNCWRDHKISCLWKRLSLTLFGLVSFVTPSSWAPSWPSCLGQGPFPGVPQTWIQPSRLPKVSLRQEVNHVPGGSERGQLTTGHICDFVAVYFSCSATTYVKGMNESLKFSSFNLPGFNIGLWRVLGCGLFLSGAVLTSFSLHVPPSARHCLPRHGDCH